MSGLSETKVSGGDEARGALAISLGQAALMLMGGVLALLITQFFGKGSGTDAFFTAYGFYVIAVAFAQGLRLTTLPRLIGDPTGQAEGRMLSAAVAMALAAGIPMVIFAAPLASLIANGDPTGVAAATLRLLWPALAMHLLAGVLVPMLTLRGIYTQIGVSMTTASLTSVVAFVLLQPELGIKAVPVGLAFSATLLAAMLATRLWQARWRPWLGAFREPLTVGRDATMLLIAAASFLVVNVGYLICLAVANHTASGNATTYAYAFFGAAFLVGTTAIPGAMVRAPRLLDAGGDRGVTQTDIVGDYRIALMLVIPALGLAAVAAVPVIRLIAGGFFSSNDADKLLQVLLALSPWVFASIGGVLVVLEMLNRGRANTLALIAFVQCVALVPLAIAGKVAGGIVGIALAQSAVMVVATWTQIRFAFPQSTAALSRSLSAATASAAAIGLVCFGPSTLLLTYRGGFAVIAGGTLFALGLYVVVARRYFTREFNLLLAIARRR